MAATTTALDPITVQQQQFTQKDGDRFMMIGGNAIASFQQHFQPLTRFRQWTTNPEEKEATAPALATLSATRPSASVTLLSCSD
jgi:hypothetical protein